MTEKSEREIFAEKYNLKKPVDKNDRSADFYWHKQSEQWLIKHDACERIHAIEKMSNPEVNVITDDNETGTFMLIKIKHKDIEWQDVGEATPQNCVSKFYRSMAFKRGIDRCVLKLLKAYELFYSDSEIEPRIKTVAKKDKSEQDLDNA
jgi:hypothetical protein|tara:strand:- start:97 stop:543 length:447 start_codon:yes stop_codon:yes gene_type:complete